MWSQPFSAVIKFKATEEFPLKVGYGDQPTRRVINASLQIGLPKASPAAGSLVNMLEISVMHKKYVSLCLLILMEW